MNKNNEMSIEAIDKFPILGFIKDVYIDKINRSEVPEKIAGDDSEMIELYHGTTSLHLQDILKNGLQPNKKQMNVWSNEIPPMKNVVYLTDVWQHYFASSAYNHYLEATLSSLELFKKRSEIEAHVKGTKLLNGTTEVFPIIIKVRVPKARLIADEDFFYSKFMNDIVSESLDKRGIVIPTYDYDDEKSVFEAFNGKLPNDEAFVVEVGLNKATWLGEKSLEFNGTVAYFGSIPPEYITEIACYPSMQTLNWTIINGNSPFRTKYHTWQQGFGKNSMNKETIKEFEKFLPRMDIKIKENILSIKKIVVDYDKKKTKVSKNGELK